MLATYTMQPDIRSATCQQPDGGPAAPLGRLRACLEQEAVGGACQGLKLRSWGRGQPLVLVHGGVGSWTHWIRNIQSLAGHFRVHAIDLPGFGDSADVPAAMAPDEYLDWVAQVLLGVAADGRKVHVAGFSFGAVVAAAVCARLGSAVEALTLLGPGGFGEPVGRRIPVQQRPRDPSLTAEIRQVLAFNLGQWMLSAAPHPDDPVVELHARNVERSRYDSREIGWRATLLADLSRISAPVQVAWGDGDGSPTPP